MQMLWANTRTTGSADRGAANRDTSRDAANRGGIDRTHRQHRLSRQHSRVTIAVVAVVALLLSAVVFVFGPATPDAFAQRDVGGPPDISACYGVADEAFGDSGGAPDGLSLINRSTGATTNIGGQTGTTDVEAIAFAPGTIIDPLLTQQVLYTFDGVDFGYLNLTTGIFSSLNLDPPDGFTTVDGMTWDSDLGVFWVTDRLSADGQADQIAAYDPTTGATTLGPFATGIATDPTFVDPTGLAYDDFDDIAIDPQEDFRLYALLNKGGTGGGLVELDKTNGAIIDYIGLFTPQAGSDFDGDGVTDDLEGLAFFDDRQLYGSTGANGPGQDINRLFLIDLDSGTPTTTYVGDFVGYGDYEALGCLTVGASIDVDKATAEPGGTPTDGPTITTRDVEWTYVITNTSAALDLGQITLVDDLEGELFNQQTGQTRCAEGVLLAAGELLAPGAFVTCTISGLTVTGDYANTATTTGVASPGFGLRDIDVSDTDPSNYIGNPVAAPTLEVVKTAVAGSGIDCASVTPVPGDGDVVSVPSGATVTFCVTVTNVGVSPITAVTVTDDNATPGNAADDVIVPTLDNIDLASGQSATGSYEVTVTSLTPLVNTVVAAGTDPFNGNPTNQPVDTAQVQAFSSPELAIVKTVVAGTSTCDIAPGPGLDSVTVDLGDVVTFCVTVTNIGATPASDVTVTDDNLTPNDPTDDFEIPGLVGLTLAAGDGASAKVEITPPTAGVNTVTAVGTDPNTGLPTNSPTDPAEVKLLGTPVLGVVKTIVAGTSDCVGVTPAPGPDDITVEYGAAVTYCVTVTNTGDTAAAEVTVTDDNLTPTDASDDVDIPGLIDITLNPNESASGALVTTATQAGVNTVTANGTDPNTGLATNSPTDPAEVALLGPPVLEVVKTVVAGTSDCVGVTPAPGLDDVTVEFGETVTFCVTVTNTGDTFATDVTITDDNFTPADATDDVDVPSLIDIRLEAGASATGALVTTATRSGVNTVTAEGTNPITGGPTNSPTDPAEVILRGSPVLDVVKTVVVGTSDCVGVTPVPGEDSVTVEINSTVTYCVTVTNTGETFATGVTVTDDNLTPADASDDIPVPGLINITLGAGESATGALVTTASQAGVNTVTAVGTDPITGAPTNSPTDPAEVQLSGLPALDVVKTAVVGDSDCVGVTPVPGPDSIVVEIGDTVTYCVTVTNTGETAATNVTVVDDSFTPADPTDDVDVPSLVDLTLAPGQSATGALVTTANRIGTNTVTASGIDPNTGNPTNSATDPAEIKLLGPPVLEVVKTAVSGTSDCVGVAPAPGDDSVTVEINSTVTYCVTVTNTGETFATGVTVVDDSLTPADPTDDVDVPGLIDIRLEAGASATGALVTTATTAAVNTVTATGTNPLTNGPTNSPTDPSEVKLLGPPILEVVKTAVAGDNVDCATVDPAPGFDEIDTVIGATVTYCITVTNTGDTTAEQVTVTDDNFTPDDTTDDTVVVGLDNITLLPGDSATGSIIFVVEVQPAQTNTVTATGVDPNTSLPTNEPTDTAGIKPPAGNAELAIVKTAAVGATVDCATVDPAPGEDAAAVKIGDSVTFCITVSNVGDGPASDVVVIDDNFTPNDTSDDKPVSGLNGIDLEPNESATGSVLVAVTELGTRINVATATGTDVNGDQPTNEPQDPSRLQPFGTPILTIVKTAAVGADVDCATVTPVAGLDELVVNVGDSVTYCIVVTNSGDGPATNVRATDDNFTPEDTTDDVVVAEAAELAPGATLIGSYTKQVTSAAALSNTAKASGTDPETGQPTNEPTDPSSVVAPAIDLTKQILRGVDQAPSQATEGVNELVVGATGDDITWVYTVTNTGSVPLIVQEITDPSVNIIVPIPADEQLIAPGASVAVTANGVVTETGATSEALVEGQPANDDGQPINSLAPLMAANDAAEGPAGVALTKQILRGNDRDCADAVEGVNEVVVGEPGDDITWCFTITNEGISSLTDLSFTDQNLGLTDVDVLAPSGAASLAPGASIQLPGENDVVPLDGALSRASVTAVPSNAAGETTGPAFVGAPTLVDTNDARNDSLEVKLEKRVLLGFDADCSTAIEGINEGVKGRLGDDVTWCFTATNTGSVALRVTEIVDVTLDVVLDIPQAQQILRSGESVTLQLNGTIDRDTVLNTASVDGAPVDPTSGDPIIDAETNAPVDSVQDTNTAAKAPFNADLKLVKTNDVPTGAAVRGAIVEYTIEVTNKGPDTARDVEVVDVLPAGLVYVDAPDVLNWSCEFNTEKTEMLCEKDRIPNEVVETLTYTVLITDTAELAVDLVNTAEVSFSGVDPTPEDNIDTAEVQIPTPDICVVGVDPGCPKVIPVCEPPNPDCTPPPPPEDEVLPEIIVHSGAHSDLMAGLALMSILTGSTLMVLGRRRREDLLELQR